MLALRVVFGMSILLLPAGLAVRLAERRWSAGERHAVWTVALVLSLLLPILLRFEPPVTAGPVILLSAGACVWTAERLGMVLTHELAHVRRRDLWWPLGGPGRRRGDEGRGAGHGGGDSGSESGVERRVGVHV